MPRREFIAGLGGAAAWPLVAWAQQQAVPVVGYLGYSNNDRRRADVLKGLADTGFVEGRNVAIEYRWVAGQDEKVPALLRDLIERRVAVLATVLSTATRLPRRQRPRLSQLYFASGGTRSPAAWSQAQHAGR